MFTMPTSTEKRSESHLVDFQLILYFKWISLGKVSYCSDPLGGSQVQEFEMSTYADPQQTFYIYCYIYYTLFSTLLELDNWNCVKMVSFIFLNDLYLLRKGKLWDDISIQKQDKVFRSRSSKREFWVSTCMFSQAKTNLLRMKCF